MSIDPNFWKPIYETEWKAGTSRVKHVLGVLKDRFPDLTIEVTEYALREGYIPPDERHERHEADIIIKKEDIVICNIEVTGSDINMIPPNDIWILKGKYLAANERQRKGIDTWFYTIYQNSEYVLDLTLVERYDGSKAQVKYLKGPPELYIEIPCAEAYPRKKLFGWIEEKMKYK